MQTLTQNFPSYYDPNKIGTLYLPAMLKAAKEGQMANVSPSSEDKKRTMLLLIDAQVDFIFPEGTLSVPGAVEDTRRTIEWIYRNVGKITTISASLDSHTSFQIFSPGWWVDEGGRHPEPFTLITVEDVLQGHWRPLIQPEWSQNYVQELEKGGKYALMVWPYHTMIGTPGNALVPALSEAIMYHASARQAQPSWLQKGSIPQSENYSILEPEVKVPEEERGGLNTSFLQTLSEYDLIYVAGQAKSHCVLATLRSIVEFFRAKPEILAKFRVLMDCTSSVVHPEVNFDQLAEAELKDMEKLGLRLVTSADTLA